MRSKLDLRGLVVAVALVLFAGPARAQLPSDR